MHFGTNQEDKVFWYDYEFKNNDFFFTFRKGEENKESVLGSVQNARDDHVRFDKVVRKNNFHHSSNPPSTSSVSISQPEQISTLKKIISYMTNVTQNPLSKKELAWWLNNLKLSNGWSIV